MTRRLMAWAVVFVMAGCAPAGSDDSAPGGGGSGGAGGGAPPRDMGVVIPRDGNVVNDCVDEDEDGFGEGAACRGPDCDDTDPTVNPNAREVCDGVDNDCAGGPDDDIAGQGCPLTLGICAGARATCEGGAFQACGEATYGDAYEQEETRCDGDDNDCDGRTDEGCACADGDQQPCGSDVGACAVGAQRCANSAWGPCDGAVEPSNESCNGADDDCDGERDEGLEPPGCPKPEGVCAGARAVCAGGGGWSCGPEQYGEQYEAEESRCDGVDNDCDGQADEGCGCADGDEQPCGGDVGACQQGVQTCVRGEWDECRGAVGPAAEVCNGLDDNCDGGRDEGLAAPSCALNQGVCVGSVQTCGGEGGWIACEAATYAEHSPAYVVEETGMHCDGADNDCDGVTDEACVCVDGDTQVCGVNVGACTQGQQRCVMGAFDDCDGVGPTGELCNGVDDDCDGDTDELVVAPECGLQLGVCAGATRVCRGGAFGDCGEAEYGAGYDGAVEQRCDTRDNDCDGTVDEGCDCVDGDIQNCGTDVGACERGSQTCVRGGWSACDGEVGPDPAGETCDGVDNDCDEETDEGVVGELCALQAGVCTGTRRACAGEGGFPACGAAVYGPSYRAVETDADCDGVDNDCDGEIDEDCECQVGAEQPVCGVDTGECQTGRLVCEDGAFGGCDGEVPPVAELCDGRDNDCDGERDEALQAPACALQAGVCAGSVMRCGNEDGWLDCDGADYGPDYAADEAGRCEGLDNDCDGTVDEGCPLPDVVISELLYDGVAADGPNVFIELAGAPGLRLNGLSLEAVNGNGGAVYATIPLDGGRVPFNGYFLVVGDQATPTLRDIADLVHPAADLQNGPDSVRLMFNGQVVDALGYLGGDPDAPEGFDDPAANAGEGDPAGAIAPGQSLSRDANNTDTGDNAADFAALERPTPGGSPIPRIHVALRWDADSTDFDLHLIRGGGAFGSADDCYFGRRTPDWGVAGDPDDNPRLDRDDVDGFGPEFIDYLDPVADTYLVEVNFFSARFDPPTNATVAVFVDDLLALELTREMNAMDHYWAAMDVRVMENGAIQVFERDEVSPNPIHNAN